MDVKYSFFNGVLEEKVYIELNGICSKGTRIQSLKVDQALYGLK